MRSIWDLLIILDRVRSIWDLSIKRSNECERLIAEIEIDPNEREINLNECEHFLKVDLDRYEIPLNKVYLYVYVYIYIYIYTYAYPRLRKTPATPVHSYLLVTSFPVSEVQRNSATVWRYETPAPGGQLVKWPWLRHWSRCFSRLRSQRRGEWRPNRSHSTLLSQTSTCLARRGVELSTRRWTKRCKRLRLWKIRRGFWCCRTRLPLEILAKSRCRITR